MSGARGVARMTVRPQDRQNLRVEEASTVGRCLGRRRIVIGLQLHAGTQRPERSHDANQSADRDARFDGHRCTSFIIMGWTITQPTEMRMSTPRKDCGWATLLPKPYFVHKAYFLQSAFSAIRNMHCIRGCHASMEGRTLAGRGVLARRTSNWLV